MIWGKELPATCPGLSGEMVAMVAMVVMVVMVAKPQGGRDGD